MSLELTSSIRYASGYLANGKVVVKGFDVKIVAPTPNVATVYQNYFHKLAHDIVDIPFANYIISRDLGKPIVAVPAFPTVFNPLLGPMVNRKAGITSVQDLVGKRVGTSGFGFNPAVIFRGIMFHHYDIPVERITWVEGEPNSMTGVPFPRSKRFTIETVNANLMDMLVAGELDALVMSDGGVEPNDAIDRLFPDYQTEVQRYFDAVGFVPINSVVTMKDEVLQANPGLDRALLDAYNAAWSAYAADQTDDGRHMELQVGALRHMGVWPPPRGFAANRNAIRTMIAYLFEQGLIRKLWEPEELFTITQ